MRCNEVRGFLEACAEEPDVAQMSEVRLHADGCQDCRFIYQNWLVADGLIKSRAAETLEPSPFLETRIIAAIREARDRARPAFLATMWQKAGLVLTSIVALVVILVSLNLLTGQTTVVTVAQDVSSGSYSTEQVVMGDPGSALDDSVTNSQVADTVFNLDN
jgi:hypothetical protein